MNMYIKYQYFMSSNAGIVSYTILKENKQTIFGSLAHFSYHFGRDFEKTRTLKQPSILLFLCPFAVYYLRYAVTSFFTLSRISLADGKRAGQKVQRKIAAAVQNVKRLYFLSRSFEISETNCQQSFFLPQSSN